MAVLSRLSPFFFNSFSFISYSYLFISFFTCRNSYTDWVVALAASFERTRTSKSCLWDRSKVAFCFIARYLRLLSSCCCLLIQLASLRDYVRRKSLVLTFVASIFFNARISSFYSIRTRFLSCSTSFSIYRRICLAWLKVRSSDSISITILVLALLTRPFYRGSSITVFS